MISQNKFLVVAGPTASGKSALAMDLARRIGGEIVSCDSVQVYRGFDIGSAKPSPSEQADIPHHLIDICDWQDDFDAARFATAAREAIADIQRRGRLAIVTGGTGLYLRALLQQAFHADLPSDETLRSKLKQRDSSDLYAELLIKDRKRAAELHPNDSYRIIRALELNILLGGPLSEKLPAMVADTNDQAVVVILDPARSVLHERIAVRTTQMLGSGLEHEVKDLLNSGVTVQCKPMQSIGYKEVAAHLAGFISGSSLAERINAATRQYAKRQCTWFRKTKAQFRLSDSLLTPEQLAELSLLISQMN